MKSPYTQRPDDQAREETEKFIAKYRALPGTKPKAGGGKKAPRKRPAVVAESAAPAAPVIVGDAPEPPAGSDPEAVEDWKYSEAKRKALEDLEVQELKAKAADTADEAEARRAMRAYNKALFAKMRKIEPSLKERIDGTEAALMKRLAEPQ